jgi:DNA-directed RNA polymerase specialized sigma24 family protein
MAVSDGEGDDRGLTREDLEALLASLDPDPERAGERYEEIRRRLIRLFEWRLCDSPEDLADETINRVARQLRAGLVLRSDPYAYFCGVARLLTLEEGRREVRKRRALELGERPPASHPEEEEPDPRLEHLHHCLQVLSRDQQQLVLRYHQDEQRIQARKQLCQELGIEMNALRIRVHRLRRKIETCIEERLQGRPSRET